jgi:hypothetical protein
MYVWGLEWVSFIGEKEKFIPTPFKYLWHGNPIT